MSSADRRLLALSASVEFFYSQTLAPHRFGTPGIVNALLRSRVDSVLPHGLLSMIAREYAADPSCIGHL